MRMVSLVCGVMVVLGAEALASPRTWELRDGRRWQEVHTAATQPARDPTLQRVEQLMGARQFADAKRLLLPWFRSHSDSPLRDRGVYLLGECNYALDERIGAFYNFDEVLDLYPDSAYYYAALQRQYDIADAFLRGHKQRVLGLALFPATDEAVEMLYRIQQRSPGSPLAEKSLRRTADHYYDTGDYELAADAYAAHARSYPRSPDVAQVRLRQAFSALAQFRGTRFDATPVIDARQQLSDLAGAYPALAVRENLPALLARIDAILARKFYQTADFYRRTRQPKAAVHYFRYIVATFPGSPEAAEARKQLSAMPADALTLPTSQPAAASAR